MAFSGNRSELTERMDLSHGLLDKLLDKNIINRRHYQVIKVSTCSFFCASVEHFTNYSVRTKTLVRLRLTAAGP